MECFFFVVCFLLNTQKIVNADKVDKKDKTLQCKYIGLHHTTLVLIIFP